MFRIHMTRLRAATAAALFSFSLAAPALADRGDWRDDDRRGYRVHRHDRRCDRDERGGYYGHGDWDRGYRDRGHWGHGRWDRNFRDRSHWRRDDREHDYRCRPCGRRWRSERELHRHWEHHHGGHRG
jgi:hypothetical protein